ncbi:hypothetical protein GTQ34_16580 [Muricauda sp. JGD-17]|uniref:Uncharacterized protein n=1 Tax=Flagellimonas ochracea TaxID=2696472 RepID=A0A964TEL2_9FLAO|nr:hypothetical protein [Allomuricauda ochracea]
MQLLDKVRLTSILNTEAHKHLRKYIAADQDHKIVTSVDLVVVEADIHIFLRADAIQLQKDKFDNLVLVLTEGTSKTSYFFSELPIFSYRYSGFCWGENRYDNLIIKNLVSEDQNCPSGTYLKASKVHVEREYLKF